ncbi:MAG: PAS domain-containing protein [Boseongicola sp.]|nr:PAS domain-containing protein [Boseongicola sp.]
MRDENYPELELHSGPVIVGVGASAGGLDAFHTLLSGLKADHSLAIILVQHLDPDHDSHLTAILSKKIAATVQTATDGTKVESGCIYLIPPGQQLTLENGKLSLSVYGKPRGLRRRPIDVFFESLAADAGVRSVGIVLSGTGTDGSTGIRAIKEAGGLVFVQDPKEAGYDGMPKSAIDTGADDLVLPTNEMVDVIHDYFSIRNNLKPCKPSDGEFITRVAKHLNYRTGHDFRLYKQSMMLRRLAMRMSALGISNPNDYVKELIANKSEAPRLFRDLLINVTSFFRDPEAFEFLAKSVLPDILVDKTVADEVRIWVPGCSTGQEALTIAMLVSEELQRTSTRPRIAIFATDIDEEAVKIARKGRYPKSIETEVPPRLLEAYFKRTSNGYEVSPSLREMVRFSTQSLTKDPPFSRVDLVSCRNVTIYFEQELQEFVVSVFHYALNEDGHLFLGPSEMPRNLENLFAKTNAHLRHFRRRPGPAQRLNFPTTSASPSYSLTESDETLRDISSEPYAKSLFTKFAPPFVVTDKDFNLIYSSERATPFLRIKPGSARLGLVQLIVPELEAALRRLMVGAHREKNCHEQEFRGKLAGRDVRILISMECLEDGTRLVVFEDRLDLLESREVVVTDGSSQGDTYVKDLENELEHARETIRTAVEELETSNEELRSSNEEMMSMNEELQSGNEELSTTNQELQNNVAELRKANDNLANLMRSTNVITLFLNEELELTFFTPACQNVFNFAVNDLGRKIEELGGDIDMDQLRDRCAAILTQEKAVEYEIETKDGSRRYTLKIEAYTEHGSKAANGIVCSMSDITVLSRAIADAQTERKLSQRNLVEIEQLYFICPQAMALLATDTTYLRINRQMAEINGLSVEAHCGEKMRDVIPDLGEQMTEVFETVLREGEPIIGHRIEGVTAARADERRVFLTDWYPVRINSEIVAVGLNFRDITDQTEMQAELRRMMQELQHRVKNMLSNVLALVSRARREADADLSVLDTLAARIKALSQTHKLLTEENWRAADIYALIRPELTDIYGEERVQLAGPNLLVNARAAVALGMAFHELATNAVKYGAFSQGAGKVSLTWMRIDDGTEERVVFRWAERDGPEVTSQSGAGFGSQLIASTISGSLHGSVETNWDPDGLVVDITVPYETLSKTNEDVIYDVF